MLYPFTYLVPAGSSIRSVADADRPGVRVAVVSNHESTLALGRVTKHAEPVEAESPDATFDLLRAGHVDAFAAALPMLLAYSMKLPGSRVVEECYGANLLAIAVSKTRLDGSPTSAKRPRRRVWCNVQSTPAASSESGWRRLEIQMFRTKFVIERTSVIGRRATD